MSDLKIKANEAYTFSKPPFSVDFQKDEIKNFTELGVDLDDFYENLQAMSAVYSGLIEVVLEDDELLIYKYLNKKSNVFREDFTIIGLKEEQPNYLNGRKTRALYKCKFTDEIVVEKVFRDILDSSGNLLCLEIDFNFYKKDGTIGLSKTETVKTLKNSPLLTPYLVDVSTNTVETNSTTDITVEGFNFDSSTVFEFSDSGAVVNSITLLSPNKAVLNISFNATEMIYALTVRNGFNPGKGTLNIESKIIITLIPGSNVFWENITAGTTTGIGTIQGNATSGWNKQATFGSIPANVDGFLEFTYVGPATDGYSMVGLTSDPTANTSYSTIDYSIYTSNGTGLSVYENASNRGSFGATSLGSVFKIERINGIIRYYKDGVVFYTSALISTSELFFDCSIYRNSQYENIRMVF